MQELGKHPPIHFDLTELPGLDELSHPTGPLANLEARAASLWGSRQTFLSVNGATTGVIASILALSNKGSHILVPVNCHRSVVSGLVLSGLEPIWYEPEWSGDWGIWGRTQPARIETLIKENRKDLVGVLVVSPTYAGCLSDVASLASVCHRHDLPLIVDEAHGAHFIPGSAMPPSAIAHGADVVVHSLHKTLAGLTQTGVLHAVSDRICPERLRACMNLLQTSSPSYLLLSSIEQTVERHLSNRNFVDHIIERRAELVSGLESLTGVSVYSPGASDPAHVTFAINGMDTAVIEKSLAERGIYCEAVLGRGLLFMLGEGTTSADIQACVAAVRDTARQQPSAVVIDQVMRKPRTGIQVLSPRVAMFAPSQAVPTIEASGCIAAELVAPCPPGNPVAVPGRILTTGNVEYCRSPRLRVLMESCEEGEN